MSSRKKYRVAPSQGGKRAAGLWSFFHQGDEFYAGHRDRIMGLVAKISFHSDGNWQTQIGSSVIRFVATQKWSDKWLQAMSLHWLLSPGAFHPHPKGTEPAVLVDLPDGSKLVIDLLQSVDTSGAKPPSDLGGDILWHERLRGGRSILLHAAVVEQTTADKERWLDVRGKTAISIKQPVPPDLYAETMLIYSDPGVGNALAIVPVGADSLRLQPPGEK